MEKPPFKSKTIIFFLVMLGYTVTEAIVKTQVDDSVDLQVVNWPTLLASVAGIFLRFVTKKPLKP